MSAGQGRPAHGLQNRTDKRSDLCQRDWLWEMPTGTAGPHGMNEKSLRDLRLLSQRRSTNYRGRTDMRLEEHFESSSTLQRNERVKLAASVWNNVGAGMVIGGMAGASLLDKPPGTWTKIGIAVAGLVLGWLCYSIASNMLTYMHTAPEERR